MRTVKYLVPVFLVLEYLYIFHAHELDSRFAGLILLLSIVLPVFILWNWLDTTKTKWDKIKLYLKIFTIEIPVIFLSLFFQKKYVDYNFEKYKTFTKGVIIGTSRTSTKGGYYQYWANVSFSSGNSLEENTCSMKYNEYEPGDSVIVFYSSDEPDICAIGGKIN